MLLLELTERLSQTTHTFKTKLATPDTVISGTQYYINQKTLDSDIIYILFDTVLPIAIMEQETSYTFLILSSQTMVNPRSNAFLNVIISNASNNYTLLINDLNKILAYNYKLTEATCNITYSFFHNEGLNEIIKNGHQLLLNPLFLIDTNDNTLAAAPDHATATTLLSSDTSLSDALKNIRSQLSVQQAPILLSNTFFHHEICASNILVGNYNLGILLLIGSEHPFAENDQRGFNTLIHIIANELGNNLLYSPTHSNTTSSLLLNDVLNTPIYPPIMLERLLQTLHFQYDTGMCFATMTFPSSPSLKLMNLFTSELNDRFPHDIYTINEEKITLLCAGTNHHLEDYILHNLKQLHLNYGVQIGVSNCFISLSDIHKHYQQSLAALSYFSKLTDPSYKYYVIFENVSQLELLKVMTKHCNLLDYCSPDIIKLLKYDTDNKSELALTLSVYLNCFGDGILAAHKLKLHKNSLYYRLGQIKKIIDNDLTDGETNYIYMFSYRTLQYLGHFHPIDL